jgi:hypothetical protein
VFIGRALRSGDPAFTGIALAMVAGLLSASKHTKLRARELSRRAVEIARGHGQHAIASATLSFVAYGHLIEGRPSQTHVFGREAEQRASVQGSGPAYPAWAARAAQAYALLWMGRLGEADALFERNARFASESGDELAAVGGDCALRHLARDDVAAAWSLMERKARLLDALGARGALRELYDRERVFCLLYEGRGQDAVASFVTRGSVVALFDPGMPLALAVLQADPGVQHRRTKRILARTQARLRAHGDAAPSQAMELQLAASTLRDDGNLPGCIAALQQSEQRYLEGEMTLHALMMRHRAAELTGDGDAALATAAEIRALGVRDVPRWLDMLAPALTPDARATVGRLQS